MPDNGRLFNPYQGVDEETSAKATAVLEKADLLLLKSLNPDRGLIQNILNMYLHSVVEQLREEGIQYYTPKNERRLFEIVRGRTIDFPVGHSTGRPDAERPASSSGGATGSISERGISEVPSNETSSKKENRAGKGRQRRSRATSKC